MPKHNTQFKAIRVSPQAKGMVKNLAKKMGKTETDLANHMIAYIYKTGLDVYNTDLPSVPDLIKTLDKRIVSFLKKREQDFFVPMQKSFREMIRVHNQTLQTLDILHPGEIGFNNPQKKEGQNSPKPSFKIPEKDSSKKVDIALPKKDDIELKKEEEKTAFSVSEKEELLDRIQRAEKEKNIFKKELVYILKNLVPNKSISGPKFNCNLPQKEIDRIKLLADGN